MTPKISGKTRAEDRSKAAIYWRKALRFAHAARTNAEQEDWDPAVANAVHAAINMTDAVVIHYVGLRSAGDSHFDALNLLPTTDMPADARTALARHLDALLSVKTLAQYEGRLLTQKDASNALKHMERAFEATAPVAKSSGWPAS